jgi:hypothetical protein
VAKAAGEPQVPVVNVSSEPMVIGSVLMKPTGTFTQALDAHPDRCAPADEAGSFRPSGREPRPCSRARLPVRSHDVGPPRGPPGGGPMRVLDQDQKDPRSGPSLLRVG